MTEQQKVKPGVEFVSNDGKGPMRARILEVTEAGVAMERWHVNAKRNTAYFVLSLEFLLSPRCGWKRIV